MSTRLQSYHVINGLGCVLAAEAGMGATNIATVSASDATIIVARIYVTTL
ncbi:MAG: hypothetical protein N2508_03890 [Anaerolineae bacterium]|nr:hypothetical protein [Anaerolineae bacterium]